MKKKRGGGLQQWGLGSNPLYEPVLRVEDGGFFRSSDKKIPCPRVKTLLGTVGVSLSYRRDLIKKITSIRRVAELPPLDDKKNIVRK